MTVKNKSKMPLCVHLGQQSKPAVIGFDHCSDLPLKFSYKSVKDPVKLLVN